MSADTTVATNPKRALWDIPYKFVYMGMPSDERLRECGFKDQAEFEDWHFSAYYRDYEFTNTDQIIHHYLHGMCAPFAIALSRQTGWEMVGAFKAGDLKFPYHVACRTPDGLYADARGTGLSENDLVSPYRGDPAVDMEVRMVTAADMARQFRRHVGEHDIAAMHVALLIPSSDLEPPPSGPTI